MPERLPRLGDRHADGFREDDRPAHGGLLSLRRQRAGLGRSQCGWVHQGQRLSRGSRARRGPRGDEPRRDVPDGPRDRRVPKGSRHPIVGQELEGRPEALAVATAGGDGGSSACESPDGVVVQDRRDGDRSGIRDGGGSQWARLRASAEALHGGAVVLARQRSSGLSGQCDDGRFTRGSGHRIAGAMGSMNDGRRKRGRQGEGVMSLAAAQVGTKVRRRSGGRHRRRQNRDRCYSQYPWWLGGSNGIGARERSQRPRRRGRARSGRASGSWSGLTGLPAMG
jgi:hypothetical protein